jgi:O-antigen ligase
MLLVTSVLLVVIWGAFAFGAVYPWAYTTLAIAASLVGGYGLVSGRRPLGNHGLFLGLASVFAVGLVQIVPLPQSALRVVSSGTDRFLRTFDLAYAFTGQAHPISIAPGATLLALCLLAALTLFLGGLLRTLSGGMSLRLARGLAGIGAVLALVGIVQKALLGDHAFAGMKIYGFWAPTYALTTPFGPFVNKNHFAGWMLMAIPVTFGLIMGTIERWCATVGRTWRDRLLWLSRPEGGQFLVLVLAALVMTLSLLMTRSRSGLGCLAVVTVAAGISVGRRFGSTRRSVLLGGSLLLFLVVVLGLAGSETAVDRVIHESDSLQLRLRIWSVSMQIARDFPILGTGLDTFGRSTVVYQPAGESLHYQEAHNDYVQLLTEGGLATVAALALCIVSIGRGIADRFRRPESRPEVYWLRVGATLGLLAIALQSLVEFSLQMPGNAALFSLVLALALYTPAHPARTKDRL